MSIEAKTALEEFKLFEWTLRGMYGTMVDMEHKAYPSLGLDTIESYKTLKTAKSNYAAIFAKNAKNSPLGITMT